jgi:5-methylcytosine-specific restriction endonuclease McrA
MKITDEQAQTVFLRDGHVCLKCGRDYGLTLDHILPKAKGGGNETENLQTLCWICNNKKGSTSTTDYRIHNIFLSTKWKGF